MNSQERVYQFGSSSGKSPLGGIGSLLVAVLFIVAVFWFLQFLFKVLLMLLPLTLIATAIIDYKVLLNYGGWIGSVFRRNPLMGLVVGGLSIVGAPVVSVFLLGRAWLGRKFKQFQTQAEAQQQQQEQSEYVDYEEVASEILDLPTLEKPQPQSEERPKGNRYEEFF